MANTITVDGAPISVALWQEEQATRAVSSQPWCTPKAAGDEEYAYNQPPAVARLKDPVAKLVVPPALDGAGTYNMTYAPTGTKAAAASAQSQGGGGH